MIKKLVTKNIILCKHKQTCSHTNQKIASSKYSYAAAVLQTNMKDYAIADSGTTGHFLQMDSECSNRQSTNDGVRVKLPDGSIIKATHTANINFPQLPMEARKAHLFPDIKHALLSISMLCDQGYIAIFDHEGVYIVKDGEVVIHGFRHPVTKLYIVKMKEDKNPPILDISTMTNLKAITEFGNNAYEIDSKKQLVMYYHKCCFSPVLSTWIKAIKNGNFCTWPGLTAKLVTKYLGKSMATQKGHLQQQHKNVRSTKPKEVEPEAEGETHECYFIIEPLATKGKTFSDQTGKFPVTSSKGNKYIMIMYSYDANAILAEPMKTRTENEIVRAFKKLNEYLVERGLKPMWHRLDNECPATLKAYMKKEEIKYQLVPPHIHRRNSAEKAIGTFKDHFIAGLASVDPQMPLHLWCRLLPQAILTLNLLRQSRINPRLSAYAVMEGQHDYNANPVAPPGIKVLIHEKSNVRRTWAPHGIEGWYLGPAMEHYRCYRVYASKTGGERISDTIEFFPQDIPMPGKSSTDRAIIAAEELTNALKDGHFNSPVNKIGNNTLAALKSLSNIFNNSTGDTNDSPKQKLHM